MLPARWVWVMLCYQQHAYLMLQYTILFSIYFLQYSLERMPFKPQDHYRIQSDNSLLHHAPNQQQVHNIYHFCQHYHHYYQHFIQLSQNIAPQATLSPLTLVSTPQAFTSILEKVNENGYVILDTIADLECSYKGLISWILIGFNNSGYLVDALALRREVVQLKQILENASIIKYCCRQIVLLQDVKRDWSAFGANYFDFSIFEKQFGLKKHSHFTNQEESERPINQSFLQYLQQRYDNTIQYLAQIKYYLSNQTEQYSTYGFSNHYEYLLKDYRHATYSFIEEEKEYIKTEMEKKQSREDQKENTFTENQADDYEMPKIIILKSERERRVSSLLINWREHMAKLQDYPAKKLLTFQQILNIASQKSMSIQEIHDILAATDSQRFNLSQKIFEILSYENQMNQNMLNELLVHSNRRVKVEKNMKWLLNELKWQGRQEWLNRKNDQSIKLYKEIVSIVELDGSVIEQFVDQMNKENIGRNQIGRFIKYAEFMRNGNHKKLKEFYDVNPTLTEKAEEQDFNDLELWDSDQDESFIINRRASRSETSIVGSYQKMPDKIDPTLATIHSPNSYSSLNSQSQLNSTSKIEPLPLNIQQIYLKAVDVKKGYQKVQKKKGQNKQGKQQVQQFVPSWQNIKCLLEV